MTPQTAACQASLSFTISQNLLKLMPYNHLVFCYLLLLLPSIFPSIRVFSKDLALPFRWPKYWSFNFVISPFNEYSRQIFFRSDWFNPLAVWGTLKSPTVRKQQFSFQPSLWSYSHILIWLLDKPWLWPYRPLLAMSLLFNTLSRIVRAFLQRAIVFRFHGCSHHMQWFWSWRK